MSTYATGAATFAAEGYDAGDTRLLRVSVCLLGSGVGVDVETDGDYDRTVVDAATARELAAELVRAADRVESAARRDGRPDPVCRR